MSWLDRELTVLGLCKKYNVTVMEIAQCQNLTTHVFTVHNVRKLFTRALPGATSNSVDGRSAEWLSERTNRR